MIANGKYLGYINGNMAFLLDFVGGGCELLQRLGFSTDIKEIRDINSTRVFLICKNIMHYT